PGSAARSIRGVFQPVAGGRTHPLDGTFHLVADARDVLVADIGHPAQQFFHIVEELLQLGGTAMQRLAGTFTGLVSGIGQVLGCPAHAHTLRLRPRRKVASATTRNTTNRILAIPAAPAAMPEKPSRAAIRAMTKKTTA